MWMAQNNLKQGRRIHRGSLGGAAAKATAGFLCGPGAPVCVTIELSPIEWTGKSFNYAAISNSFL